MDISLFSTFGYDDKQSLSDFLLVNGMSHENYNIALMNLGVEPLSYPLLDMADSKTGSEDWLQTHYLMHKQLAANISISAPQIPDLTDVEVDDPEQWYSWLQVHMQQHQLIDAALGI